MPKKAKVEYTQNSEPAFIAEFKKRAGIVAEPTVESKRTALSLDQNEDGDRPDEQPQLVWTASSGVTEEEARDFLKQNTIKDPVKDTDHSGGEAAREGVQVGPLPKPSKIRFVPRSEREESKRLNDQSPNRRSREETERDRSPITRTSSGQSKQGFLSFDMEEEEDDEN